MELRCRQERSAQEQQLEEEAARHKLHVEAMKREQERAVQDEKHAQNLRYAQEQMQMELEAKRAEHDEDARREREKMDAMTKQLAASMEAEQAKYEKLKGLGVDLTQYLCAMVTKGP